jgi:hypothetical protein
LRGGDFSKSDFSDEDLQELASCSGMHLLDVRQSGVTEVGVRRFKQAVPGCFVSSDFGEFGFEPRPLPE